MNRIALSVLSASACVLAACTRMPAVPATPVNDGCLHYSPAQTELVGKAYTKEVTAPGKATRKALLMKLDAPACISPLPGSHAEFQRVDSIQDIELVPQSNAVEAMQLDGYRVRAKGALATMQGDGVAAPVGMSLLSLGPETPGQ